MKENANDIETNFVFNLYSSSDGLLYIQGFKSFVQEWFSTDDVGIYKFSDGECRRNMLKNSSKKAKATVIESKSCSAEKKEEMIAYWVPKRGEKFIDYINIGAQCFDSSDIQIQGTEMAAQFSEFRLIVDICRENLKNGQHYNYFTDFDCNDMINS